MAILAVPAANKPPMAGPTARYADTTGITDMRMGPVLAAQARRLGPIVGMGLPMTPIAAQERAGRSLRPGAMAGGRAGS
jgi:hypothetical protein